MSRRIKVLQIQPEYNVKSSDISDLAEQIVKSLPSNQYEVTSAYIYGRPKPEQALSIAEHVEFLDCKESDMSGLRIKVLLKLYQFCKQHQFDVIICHRFKIVSLMLQLNKLLKAPLCIGISHVMDEYRRPYRRWQIKLLADKHWRFVGVSDAVKEWLISYGMGFTTRNTQAIPNAIDIAKSETSQLNSLSARSALGLPEDKLIIGAIGQLFARKGHRYLISALANLKHEFPDAHIGIIGKGPEEQNLRQQINSLGLQGRVHLLGFRENALQYVRAFDIWAMPSLKEGLPLALMEGISGHLPIIASDIPEMRDMILGAGGLAVPAKDVMGLTNALRQYLALDRESLRAKGEQAYDFLSTHHSIEAYRSSYRKLIENKLKEVNL
ncbi:glycosyltransferase family 4 protein [Methylobacillus gramineus]|uniref:glycosyltransferase family 4 protein n=1 Tax=Methylobacillus gramineus TaxID=755169 RepID=UPI001CFFC121|nr:glycosyltransferase family 4 protein [Methylobacillus gramineus]MCB5184892.1 glycosyltransferase family 4 protein [Methylobacillus gramineus]